MTLGVVEVARVYGLRPRSGEYRILVDRLWPRGLSKQALDCDEWLKTVAPSNALRKWYGHDPERFSDFALRYGSELASEAASTELARLRTVALEQGLLLLTATRELQFSAAGILAEILTSPNARAD